MKAENFNYANSKIKSGLLLMLIAFFLLSPCSIRKSIHIYLLTISDIEISNSGLTSQKPANAYGLVSASFCSNSSKEVFEPMNQSESVQSVLPVCMNLFHYPAKSSAGLMEDRFNTSLIYLSKPDRSFNETPLYIQHRILLI